jgi:hypothetical protein
VLVKAQTSRPLEALKGLVPLQPHGVLSCTEDYGESHQEELHRLTRGMIKASRALHDDFGAFENTFRHQVTIPVPGEAVREIWERERSAGSFAVDGGLAEAHWAAKLDSFEGLTRNCRASSWTMSSPANLSPKRFKRWACMKGRRNF